MAEDPSEFQRGVEAGRVEQTLLEHTDHLSKINGSVEKMADAQIAVSREMHAIRLELQRLADRMDADAATALATAAALAKDEAARRFRDQRRWSPWARLATAIGAVAALATIVAVWLSTR